MKNQTLAEKLSKQGIKQMPGLTRNNNRMISWLLNFIWDNDNNMFTTKAKVEIKTQYFGSWQTLEPVKNLN